MLLPSFVPLLFVLSSGAGAPQPAPTPRIVFVCEHGAAKSLIAAAYFNMLAAGRGLPARATFRGVDPQDDLSVRAGVVNAFDSEQAPYLGTTLYSNFDPYGRRFFIGLNYRPF